MIQRGNWRELPWAYSAAIRMEVRIASRIHAPSTVRCLIYFVPGLLRSFLARHWGIVISYVDGVFSEGTNSNAFACSLRQDFKRR